MTFRTKVVTTRCQVAAQDFPHVFARLVAAKKCRRPSLAAPTLAPAQAASGATGRPPSSGQVCRYHPDNPTGPSGTVSFAQALAAVQSDNSGTPSEIDFNIPASGVQVLQDMGPVRLDHRVFINGYSQASAAGSARPNTKLDSDDAVILIEYPSLLDFEASGITVAGLSVYGINIGDASSNNTISGNFIGVDPTGTTALPVPPGILQGNAGVNVLSNGNTIGASTGQNIYISAAQRNIISGNEGHGVAIDGGRGNMVGDNFIGVDASGSKALPNGGGGVLIQNSTSGPRANAIDQNVISGN